MTRGNNKKKVELKNKNTFRVVSNLGKAGDGVTFTAGGGGLA